MSLILDTQGLTKAFRGLVANENIEFQLEEGDIRSVIGPNGAGKTTFLSLISGHLTPTAGRIVYRGRDISRLSVVDRARLGIARKFQTPSVFHNLSVYENIELATFRIPDLGDRRHARIMEVIELVRLTDDRETPVQFLSHGQRQWLEIGLLVAMEAELMLLDEPAAGMTAEETAATVKLIRQLAGALTVSVIVIEHDMSFIRLLGADVTVLHLGRVLVEGSFQDVAANQQVRDVYLGHHS
jgi:ABC-type uncharacterized transport system ATPase subunit